MKKRRGWAAVFAILAAVLCGCTSNGLQSGVGTFVIVNDAETTISFNYRFAVPEAWRGHALWFLDEPISLDPGQTWGTRESNEHHDLRVIIGMTTYDHYDAFVVDADYTAYVHVYGDGSIAVSRFQPYF